jgi:hypothetical protein
LPIENQLQFTSAEEHAGWLEKDKGESFANAAVRKWILYKYILN